MLLLVLSVWGLVYVGQAWSAEATEVSPTKPAEYMIYQYPGVALLVRVDAQEMEFASRVYGPARALIKASHVPKRRIGPVYQFIDAVDTARQLIIEVTPTSSLERSRISMEFVQLDTNQRTNALQTEAFRIMSRAMDITPANDSSTWAMKSYTFRNTAQAFEQLGWEELRLWSEYYAAHLVFYKLGDKLSAIELARQVQMGAGRAGFSEIELAALQLEGAARLDAGGAAPGLSAEQQYEQTHQVLEQAARLATELGFESERALALYNDGLAWEQQEEFSRALAQFRLALDFAVSANDTDLANQIRNKAASTYENQGSVSGAIEMLDQIGNELSEDDLALELADSLYDKGRILFASYRYPESVAALTQAYDLQKSAGSNIRLARTGLTLGQALFGMGELSQAAAVLQDSVSRLSSSGYEIDRIKALQSLAAIRRIERDFPAMSESRAEQAEIIQTDSWRARHLFDSAMDQFASEGPVSSGGRSLLRRSRQLAIASGERMLADRALLQYCSRGSGSSQNQGECARSRVQQALNRLVSGGIPRYALEARFSQTRILQSQGRLDQAVILMGQLMEEIRFYRELLPGVLGGWYWEQRESIFDHYLSLVLQQSKSARGEVVDGSLALSALERLWAIENLDSRADNRDGSVSESEVSSDIRSLLMAREGMVNQADIRKAEASINSTLDKYKAEFISALPRAVFEGQNSLLRFIPAESILLTYFFSGPNAWSIVAGSTGVKLMNLGRNNDTRAMLVSLRDALASGTRVDINNLNKLGDFLLKPIAGQLTEQLFFIPGGPLNGFPFDLLRLGDRYLVEQFRVVNLTSLSSVLNPTVRIDPAEAGLVFLAGDPEAKRDVFNYDQKLSAEVRAVTDIFVGPGLHIVQGSALKRDEFQDERFEQANLIHLAIPGMISLDNPMRSVLMLSARPEKAESDSLRPLDFQNRRFNAALAILSATGTNGINDSGFSNYLGFVSDLLQSGVQSVLASLWTLGDAERARFMMAFYGNLARNPDVIQALLNTRRNFLRETEIDDLHLWAGFQVYFN
jgi:CHAT domain-containing protein/tetratricopeptide (TPR) repeat protein